jgi:hypothetical protein
MHLGVLPGHDLAIEPDPALALVKGDDGGHGGLQRFCDAAQSVQ